MPALKLKLTALLTLLAILLSACQSATVAPVSTPTPVKTDAPTATALPPSPTHTQVPPTPTITKTLLSTATVTATVTPTETVKVLDSFTMAVSWTEMQGNEDGFRASWDSLIDGTLDPVYLNGTPVFRPTPIGYIRLEINSYIESLLIKKGVKLSSNIKDNYYYALLVLHWTKQVGVDGKSEYIPRILTYNASYSNNTEYQKNLKSLRALYPWVTIPSGGMYDGYPVEAPMSEYEFWAKNGFPGPALETKFLLGGTPFLWP
jgi:hypothetical protein